MHHAIILAESVAITCGAYLLVAIPAWRIRHARRSRARLYQLAFGRRRA